MANATFCYFESIIAVVKVVKETEEKKIRGQNYFPEIEFGLMSNIACFFAPVNMMP